MENLTLCLAASLLELETSQPLWSYPCSWWSPRSSWVSQNIISNIRNVCSFCKSPLCWTLPQQHRLPWAWASLCFLSCRRRIQQGPFISISIEIHCYRIMLSDPEQFRVLKIVFFCSAACWFKRCCRVCRYLVFSSILAWGLLKGSTLLLVCSLVILVYHCASIGF